MAASGAPGADSACGSTRRGHRRPLVGLGGGGRERGDDQRKHVEVNQKVEVAQRVPKQTNRSTVVDVGGTTPKIEDGIWPAFPSDLMSVSGRSQSVVTLVIVCVMGGARGVSSEQWGVSLCHS